MTCSIGPRDCRSSIVPRPACVRVPGVHQRFFTLFVVFVGLIPSEIKSCSSLSSLNKRPPEWARQRAAVAVVSMIFASFFFRKMNEKDKKKIFACCSCKDDVHFPVYLFGENTHTHTKESNFLLENDTFSRPPPPPCPLVVVDGPINSRLCRCVRDDVCTVCVRLFSSSPSSTCSFSSSASW